jgi:hypothetical protein
MNANSNAALQVVQDGGPGLPPTGIHVPDPVNTCPSGRQSCNRAYFHSFLGLQADVIGRPPPLGPAVARWRITCTRQLGLLLAPESSRNFFSVLRLMQIRQSARHVRLGHAVRHPSYRKRPGRTPSSSFGRSFSREIQYFLGADDLAVFTRCRAIGHAGADKHSDHRIAC